MANKTVGYEASYDIPLPLVTDIVTKGIACYYEEKVMFGYEVTGVFMSVKDLLEKVNNTQLGNNKTQMIQETDENKPVSENSENITVVEVGDVVDLSKLTSQELLELGKQLRSWLETHECQTGTDNKLDINDRPYYHELYLKKLRQYEESAVEYFRRPLGEELVGVL